MLHVYVHETLLWVNSMMTFLLVFTVPHSIANSDFECSSMVQSLQQPLRPQVSKHGQGVSCLAPLGLMFLSRCSFIPLDLPAVLQHQREHGHSKLLFPVVCFFFKEPAGSLGDGGYDLSSGHTLLKYLHTFVFLLTDTLAFESVFAYAALMCTGTRLCVGTRLHRLHLYLNLIKAPGPSVDRGDGNGGRFVRSFCFFFFVARFCVPLVTVVQCLLRQLVGVILSRCDTARVDAVSLTSRHEKMPTPGKEQRTGTPRVATNPTTGVTFNIDGVLKFFCAGLFTGFEVAGETSSSTPSLCRRSLVGLPRVCPRCVGGRGGVWSRFVVVRFLFVSLVGSGAPSFWACGLATCSRQLPSSFGTT